MSSITCLVKSKHEFLSNYFQTLIDKYQLPLQINDIVEDNLGLCTYMVIKPTQTIKGRNIHKERILNFDFIQISLHKSSITHYYHCDIMIRSIVKPYKSRSENDMYIMGSKSCVASLIQLNYDSYFKELKEKLSIISNK